MGKNSANKPVVTKAGALLCPICCVEYVEVTFDCEFNGVILHDVKALRCPNCEQEVFSPVQQEEISKKFSNKDVNKV